MNNSENLKTVIALSQAFDHRLAVQLNALGHLAQSLGHQAAHKRVGHYVSYHDVSGTDLGMLSWWPLIVLTGRPTKIGELWSALQREQCVRACFVDTMIQGGSEAQLAATAEVGLKDERIVALAAFGLSERLNALTKKLSLWKGPRPVSNSDLVPPVSPPPLDVVR